MLEGGVRALKLSLSAVESGLIYCLQLDIDELMAEEVREDQDGGLGLLVFRIREVGRGFATR